MINIGGEMNSLERRQEIIESLKSSKEPIKGKSLADTYKVTRQVIVKDIAIIKAEGYNIVSTPKGYMMIDADYEEKIKKVIAVSHSKEQMKDELMTIIKYGGIVQDVVVEHALYGEIRGMLMIKTVHDVESFYEKYKKYNDKPLSVLTNGVHLHTIICDSEEAINKIMSELNEKGYLFG